jgi:hypothetical protein
MMTSTSNCYNIGDTRLGKSNYIGRIPISQLTVDIIASCPQSAVRPECERMITSTTNCYNIGEDLGKHSHIGRILITQLA